MSSCADVRMVGLETGNEPAPHTLRLRSFRIPLDSLPSLAHQLYISMNDRSLQFCLLHWIYSSPLGSVVERITSNAVFGHDKVISSILIVGRFFCRIHGLLLSFFIPPF